MEELREEYRQSLARKLPALGYNIPPDVDLLDLKLTPDMMAQLESRYHVTNIVVMTMHFTISANT